MGQKLVIGPITKGLRKDVTPFNIDNDSFPVLINAYQWRARVKRKRGTSTLGRLTRQLENITLTGQAFGASAIYADIFANASINLRGSQPAASIAPGTVNITVGAITFTDSATLNGTLVGTPGANTGTINYASGALSLSFSPALGILTDVVISFDYYPQLPVMGLEDLILETNQYPGTIAFDTTYSYDISTSFPFSIHDVSFYKNPSTATYVGYTQKASDTTTTWNGQNYQQFWTVNYEGALWATNGINVPFSITNIGMQYKPIVSVTVISGGPPATATLQITAHGLVVGDFVYVNEVVTTTGINFQTGYVITVTDANNVIVEFPNATIATNGTGGIAQYLTNRSDTTKDSLRWYDGDPTTGNNGWVNFSPPISKSSFSIGNLPEAQYYLVGARMIVPFKDRLLFIGPVVQTSAAGSQKYLQDTVIYSQNGTPYYTSSFTGDASLATTVFSPVLVPDNQTATAPAYWSDQTGFGGFVTIGIDEPILTVGSSEDVLILGLSNTQIRMIYSGNDIVPFQFYIINSELGSSSTFSSINMDRGVLSRGDRGYVIASQVDAKRFDVEIPDQAFEMRLIDNGAERFCAQRDFINEWIYFTYCSNQLKSSKYVFPTQTLFYNYRDNSFAIFNECYTTYGAFRQRTGYTWATIGTRFPTWSSWNEPWNSGSTTLLQPQVIGGNQQGFVMIRDDGTNEGNSLSIQSFTLNVVTSPNHCLSNGDYITISGCLGAVGTYVNNKIFSIYNVTTDTFALNPASIVSDNYLGGGLIKRMYVPFIQTKQFPVAWDMARKTRIGPQQYLLTATDESEITLLIYLSQNSAGPYNKGPIVPSTSSTNNSLIYGTVLYTCTESCNLGLTPANTNLQMISVISADGDDASSPQEQLWHRVNTSLIGDTVQLGFTLSDEQMREVTDDDKPISQFSEIELHSFIIDVTPSQVLA